MLAAHKPARKAGKPRVIPIGTALAKILHEAIGGRTAGAVFLTDRGKPWTVCALGDVHRRLRDAAGLDRAIVLYCGRHRFPSTPSPPSENGSPG
ncbi:MAG: hypothetical protein ACM3U2_04225 [Deltaproteobacteria bacterium]